MRRRRITAPQRASRPVASSQSVPGSGTVDEVGSAVPLRSTRSPVATPSLVTRKSSVFNPLTKPELIVKGVKQWYWQLADISVGLPFNEMLDSLSDANSPLITTVPRSSP